MTSALHQLHALPEGFLDVPATRLHEILPGPSLIHLQGEVAAPLFISVLLHGNETTGFEAVQHLLREFQDRALPRAISLFVGNISAARQGLRVLPGQSDFNRIWPDAEGRPSTRASGEEAAMMAEIVAQMRARGVFASLDLHNTSGRNPHHACVISPSASSLHLASMFSRQILFFETPTGVQNMAFAGLCPAMTAECGQAGRSDGVGLTVEFLHRCLHLNSLPETLPEGDFELYKSMATVKIPEHVDFTFNGGRAALQFVAQIDGYNWREIPAGTQLAAVQGLTGEVLEAKAPNGQDLSADLLLRAGDKLLTRRALVPAMLSLDESIVRQDCLCYFLERVS